MGKALRPSESRTCIFCSKTGNAERRHGKLGTFNSEHVLPKAFRKFPGNLGTLQCVCAECNSFFGETLVPVLAFDAEPGVNRLKLGLETSHYSMSESGASVRMNFLGHELPVKATHFEAGRGLGIEPRNRIGLFDRVRGEYVYYSFSDLPRRESLDTEKFDLTFERLIKIEGDLELGERVVRERGYALTHKTTEEWRIPRDSVLVIRYEYNELHFRAYAYLMFNCLAKLLEEEDRIGLLLTPRFDSIRKWIRHGSVDPHIQYYADNRRLADELTTNVQLGSTNICVFNQTDAGYLIARISILQDIHVCFLIPLGLEAPLLDKNVGLIWDYDRNEIHKVECPRVEISRHDGCTVTPKYITNFPLIPFWDYGM